MKIIDWIFPKNIKCIFCGKEDDKFGICDECIKTLPFIKGNKCLKCGIPLEEDGYCNDCMETSHEFLQNYSVLMYDKNIAKKIVEFKQFKKKYLGDVFSFLMLEAYEKLNLNIDIVIPIPISKERLKERGFNQTEILVKRIADKYKNVNNNILSRIKDTPHQTGLSREFRKDNLHNAFKVLDKKVIKNKTILLIDDIYTTGTTLDECSRTLYNNGASKVYALCLARGMNKER